MQFYPNFALFSTLGGMNLDHDFVEMSKLSEDQTKKRFSPKMNTFFPISDEDQKKKDLHQKWNTFFPRFQMDNSAQMHTRVKLFGGDADLDHIQTIGGDTVKLLKDISPPSPRVSAPLVFVLLLL